MQVLYNAKTDTLYIRLDESKQAVINSAFQTMWFWMSVKAIKLLALKL